MSTAYVIKFKSKTRITDEVRSQPWMIDSVWLSEDDAKADMERMESENSSFDYMIEDVDFYPRGKTKPY